MVLVTHDSPAEKAGLITKDVILKFNGTTVKDTKDLLGRVRNCSPGETVTLTVFRDRRLVGLVANISERPDAKQNETHAEREKPNTSFEDAIRKFNAVPGDDYVEKPPPSMPKDERFIVLNGRIETRDGDLIICKTHTTSYSRSDEILPGKWAFKSNSFRLISRGLMKKSELLAK